MLAQALECIPMCQRGRNLRHAKGWICGTLSCTWAQETLYLNLTHRRELFPIIPSIVSTQLWSPLRLKELLKDNISAQKSNKRDNHTLKWRTSHASKRDAKEKNESGHFADRVAAAFRKEMLDLSSEEQ